MLFRSYGDFYKGNNNLPQNRITPAGFFTFGLRDATRSAAEAKTAGEYDYGKVFVLDKVISGEYSITIFHSAWLHESDAAMRARALASAGCSAAAAPPALTNSSITANAAQRDISGS